jgi:membrane protease YdiL (CAAX protease family)
MNEPEIENTALKRENDFRITSFSVLLIVFLCVVWPFSIAFFFTPPAGINPGEIANPILKFYLPTFCLQLAVLLVIILVCRSEGSSLKELGFRNLHFVHIIYAIIFFFASSIILRAIKDILISFEIFKFQNTAGLLPLTIYEKIAWVILCMVVAFNEETAYRGYLITRLTKITKSPALAVFIATAGFAAGHIYQGTGGLILLFIYGLMFAGLYLASKSLWPCVIAHFINNAIVIFAGTPFIIPPFW